MKPNVFYMSQFYLELTPAAGLDHKLNTFVVFSQQGISSGCRIHQRGLHVANTHFVSWSFSSSLNVLSSRAGLLHLWQLWDGKYHLQGMLPDSIPNEIIQNSERKSLSEAKRAEPCQGGGMGVSEE